MVGVGPTPAVRGRGPANQWAGPVTEVRPAIRDVDARALTVRSALACDDPHDPVRRGTAVAEPRSGDPDGASRCGATHAGASRTVVTRVGRDAAGSGTRCTCWVTPRCDRLLLGCRTGPVGPGQALLGRRHRPSWRWPRGCRPCPRRP